MCPPRVEKSPLLSQSLGPVLWQGVKMPENPPGPDTTFDAVGLDHPRQGIGLKPIYRPRNGLAQNRIYLNDIFKENTSVHETAIAVNAKASAVNFKELLLPCLAI